MRDGGFPHLSCTIRRAPIKQRAQWAPPHRTDRSTRPKWAIDAITIVRGLVREPDRAAAAPRESATFAIRAEPGNVASIKIREDVPIKLCAHAHMRSSLIAPLQSIAHPATLTIRCAGNLISRSWAPGVWVCTTTTRRPMFATHG